MPLFWRYISFSRYFLIILIYNCFWIIFLWIFWKFCKNIFLRFYYQSNRQLLWLFFDIPLLYYYIYLSSSIISRLFSRNISLFRYFFIILICNYLLIVLLWIFWNFFDFISNFVTDQIISYLCWYLNCSFEAVLNESVADCLS